MASEENKNDGPACACGKGDLYEQWLKQNEKINEEPVSDASSTKETPDDSRYAEDIVDKVQDQENFKE